MVDHGPPSNAFDMPDGRRAFQWTEETTHNSGSATWVNSNTQIYGGQTETSECFFTFFGVWEENQNAWIITDFNKPDFLCE